ncbi:pro convertase subtilisin kexin type 4-like, partial [Paramuricea clavata]
IPRDSEFEWIVVEPGTGEFVVIKPRQAKGVSSHPDSSTNEERPAIDEQQVGTDSADSYLFSCPEDGCIKSYMTHGRLKQHLMYGRHNFRQNQNVLLLDRVKISYADRLEEERGGQSLITMTGLTEVGTTMASKRKGATESDDEAEEFTRHQAEVNSNVLETLKQDVAHPVLFSGKSLCQLTKEEIGNLKITQLRSMTSHFGISVKGRAKA